LRTRHHSAIPSASRDRWCSSTPDPRPGRPHPEQAHLHPHGHPLLTAPVLGYLLRGHEEKIERPSSCFSSRARGRHCVDAARVTEQMKRITQRSRSRFGGPRACPHHLRSTAFIPPRPPPFLRRPLIYLGGGLVTPAGPASGHLRSTVPSASNIASASRTMVAPRRPPSPVQRGARHRGLADRCARRVLEHLARGIEVPAGCLGLCRHHDSPAAEPPLRQVSVPISRWLRARLDQGARLGSITWRR